MNIVGAKAKISTREEAKHIRIGTLSVSTARILIVLYKSKTKMSIRKIISVVAVHFKHESTPEKGLRLCSVEIRNYPPLIMGDAEGYTLTTTGKKLVECALRSYAMDPIKYENYIKFVRTSTSPNVYNKRSPKVQSTVPIQNIDPALLNARIIEAELDCV